MDAPTTASHCSAVTIAMLTPKSIAVPIPFQGWNWNSNNKLIGIGLTKERVAARTISTNSVAANPGADHDATQ